MTSDQPKKALIPKVGPDPTLLSRKEVDVLYDTLDDVINALARLGVDAIVTGGSLLGAVRQHSILFCDDDIDLTIIDHDGSVYETIVRPNLQNELGDQYLYQIAPWEGGDRIRPKRMSNVFLDLFVLKRYNNLDDLKQLIGVKKNGKPQSEGYINEIVDKMVSAANAQGETTPLCPFWHFATRKAVEMWTKEVYRDSELFPLERNLKMGPVVGIAGPRMPVTLLKRAFGVDCFDVYFQSASHRTEPQTQNHHKETLTDPDEHLPPLVLAGGTWEAGTKTPLEESHYLPMQPTSRAKRRHTLHNKAQLYSYLEMQSAREKGWMQETTNRESSPDLLRSRPNRTIYMDGVFDLFHIGHLEAIQKCSELGNRVIIGVTGDADATGYKRAPIVPESERVAIIKALKDVDEVVCPCPLIVTEEFMQKHGIDLVVHGFANDADAKRQEEFFAIPAATGRFQRISYYHGLSTTDRIRNIQSLVAPNLGPVDKALLDDRPGKPNKWFGSTLAAVTQSATSIPFDPFPITLRQAIEPHIEKARKRREETFGAVREATGVSECDAIMAQFYGNLAKEGDFDFDNTQNPLREMLLESLNLPFDFDLSRIHEVEGRKDELMELLASQREPSLFQQAYDAFVRDVCAPHMASTLEGCNEIYYQAYPCIRIVQPDEFSIGPHSDIAYGHHPCSVNYYVPLTQIGGASSLFLESRPGAEDWHPIEGNYGKGA